MSITSEEGTKTTLRSGLVGPICEVTSRARAHQRKVHFLSIIVKLPLRVNGNGGSILQSRVVSVHIGHCIIHPMKYIS